ncbi:plastocyanin/azurin family copper-binding protein [Natronococcus sp. A-GB7]|uniref:cupredoxin domain-containing protein n=1 Tax=Natronococcus sp. A-GB7 TaxID=3037649 RepID=UPI0024201D73|nr:plastocyanin/azurin family copper-binding protein [Natronococcus sp. A-GB7]MDG5817827.1 plastocyanin/azurin family copper-binding protein [Natronococcus sp. A-GB7]
MSGLQSSRRRLVAVAGALLGTGLAGCVDDELGKDDPLIGDPEAHLEIELTDEDGEPRLDPPIAHVVDGGTVEWIAESGTHEVVAYHPETHRDQQRITEDSDPWEREVAPSSRFDRVFDGEGVYDYACRTHEDRGMVGTVLVGLPAPEEQPGLTHPSETYPDAASEALKRQNDRIREILAEAHE